MNYIGIIIGVASWIFIALGHIFVIKGEYLFTKKLWITFLIVGSLFVIGALFIENLLISTLVAMFGFNLLWGIGELFQQEDRVKKGWFPKNPKHKY